MVICEPTTNRYQIDECIEEAHGNFKQLFQEQIIGVMGVLQMREEVAPCLHLPR